MSSPFRDFFISVIGQSLKDKVVGLTGTLVGIILNVGEDSLEIAFEITEALCNYNGFMHGGTHAAIMDDVMGMNVAAVVGNESQFVSVNLSLDMLGTVRSGQRVIAKSQIIRKGRQIINVYCEIYTPEGKVISRGTQNLVTSNPSKINENYQST